MRINNKSGFLMVGSPPSTTSPDEKSSACSSKSAMQHYWREMAKLNRHWLFAESTARTGYGLLAPTESLLSVSSVSATMSALQKCLTTPL